MSQQDQNRELILELYRSVDAQDVERCRQLVSATCKPQVAGNTLDIESWIAMGKMFMSAFPDGRHELERVDAVGDYVLVGGWFTGTQRGEFQGIPATGKRVRFSLTMIDKVVDGKVVEHRGDFDSATMIQQLSQ